MIGFLVNILLIICGIIPASILRFFCKKGFKKALAIFLIIILAPIGIGIGAGVAYLFGIQVFKPSIIAMTLIGSANYLILCNEF